ncbi:Na+/H+ antiporter NhaA [Pseudooceanicola sp. CBS1P-1]|uniref:Na(+)/H(+) antiporter NhaA n=1 Tax=Pseudooceanicola albus TaxID=2692189 RepID=A0A6L7GC86_9RHOB|nr:MULTISPECIES: Na+/H+ antiporter NhaA [Pseudooceanicola]MBT9386419.1 Na+/H+ antiporter NhaA [Pseudooceanicola endophyticus]MXN20423.1 Na+/H+ antiporter NhaA [Pseudooceanicola albus]
MGLRRELDRFFSSDASGGIFLILATALALIVANSALGPAYDEWLHTYLKISFGESELKNSLLHWINDGLMAVFFFLVGLELKYELLEGKLKNPSDVIMPGMAAVAGMACPAIVFVALNLGNAANLGGWAIPAATDIAFALGVLALVGPKVPSSLKIFLLTLAILDDMGAIVVIALFYTADLQVNYLLMALLPLAAMFVLHKRKVHRVAPLLMLGLVLWFLVLKSGVHATLAGVLTAFFIPLKDKYGKSPLHALEHGLSPYVLFFIVPLFAFGNAGVVLKGMTFSDLLDPLALGVAGGLVIGKQVGVFAVVWIMVKTGLARMPAGASWGHIYGVACLAGIGFTMSLFIGTLSFDDATMMNSVRLGVLVGSAISAVLGFTVLKLVSRGAKEEVPAKAAA